ncbi:MAG: HesA/MoeB/ThiF family protein [Bacilli bacterium]
MNRFARNYSTISLDQQKYLKQIRILVVGLGGLGGIVSEGLIRLGIYNLGICDFDVVEESNLNRQLLSNENNLGNSKILECQKRLLSINKDIDVTCYDKLTKDNKKLLNDFSSYDLVIDCLDNYDTRLLLHNLCFKNNLKVIYGAIAGDYGYFGVSTKENMLIFDDKMGIEKELGNPFYTPAIIGSMQIKLTLDVIFNKEYLRNGFYYLDLNSFTIEEINLQ